MKLDVIIDDRKKPIEIADTLPVGAGEFVFDSRTAQADVREPEPGVYSILIEHRSFEVIIEPWPGVPTEDAPGLVAVVRGRRYTVEVRDPRRLARRHGPLASAGRQRVISPMPGKVVRILVQEGAAVTTGQGLLVIEAMKMQNEIRSPKDGRVAAMHAAEGAAVAGGEVLAEVE